MVFPLMALGAGLGQFAQQYQQQQESAIRQMALKQQLDQILQTREGENLLGSVLRQGGKIPGLGGFSMQGGGGPFGLPQQSQPQQPQQGPQDIRPQWAQMPPLERTGPHNIGGGSLQPAPAMPPRTVTVEPMSSTAEVASAPVPAAPEPPQQAPEPVVPPDQDTEALPTPSSNLVPGSIPLDEPAPPTTSTKGEDGVITNQQDTPIDTAASAPAQASTGAYTPVQTQGEFSQIMSMFHQTEPSEIAAHISKLRPDASDGAVWRATAALMKMTSRGSMSEQLAAANMMKYLIGEGGRMTRAGMASADRGAARDLRAGIATGNVGGAPTVASTESDRKARQGDRRGDQTDERLKIQRERETRQGAQFDMRRAERAAAAATGATKAALNSLLAYSRQLAAQIYAIDNGMDANKPERRAQRDKLQAQMDDLGKKIEERTVAAEKANPVAAPTP